MYPLIPIVQSLDWTIAVGFRDRMAEIFQLAPHLRILLWLTVAYVVIAGYVMAKGQRKRRRTPYDNVDLRSPGCNPAPFDLFVSYKSEDVHFVRNVVNRLLANGHRVWFAEYMILLSSRDKFEAAIEDGIKNSKFGVAFTNQKYAQSEYCKDELKQLLTAPSLGPSKVAIIQCPQDDTLHEEFPSLAFCHSTDIGFSEEVEKATRAICELAHLEAAGIDKAHNPQEVRFYYSHEAYYSLDISGWTMRDIAVPKGYPKGCVFGPTAGGRVGQWTASWHLDVSPEPMANRRQEQHLGLLDERETFNMMVAWTSKYVGSVSDKCVSVNLIFNSGRSHMYCVYWFRTVWNRKYAIVLPHPKTGEFIEFLFSIQFSGPFTEMCKYAEEMDRLVKSLRWVV